MEYHKAEFHAAFGRDFNARAENDWWLLAIGYYYGSTLHNAGITIDAWLDAVFYGPHADSHP